MTIFQGVKTMLNNIFFSDDASQLKKIHKKLRSDDSVINNESFSDARQKAFLTLKSLDKRMLILNKIQFMFMIPVIVFILSYAFHLHSNGLFDNYCIKISIAAISFVVLEFLLLVYFEIIKSKQRTVMQISHYLLGIL